jgi:phospholipase/lecithinase/hemolysin
MSIPLLTLAMGCGGAEVSGNEGAPESPGDVTQQEACLTMLHEDANFSREMEHDLARMRQEGRETDIACLREGAYTRADLERLGFTAPETGSIDVSNGYRATLYFADGTTSVYVDSRGALRKAERRPELLSVKVEWCPVSVALEGQPDAQALCLGLGDSRLEGLKSGTEEARIRELRVAPGYGLELWGRDGTRYHADRTVSGGKRLAAIRQPASIERAVVSRDHGSGVSAAASGRIDLAAPEGQVSAMALPTPSSLSSINRVVILGDSLSDQRNMHNSYAFWIPNGHHGYWNGRFTNGFNWVDYIVRDYKVLSTKIHNHAVGGSEARNDLTLRPSLKTQASRYVDDLRQKGQLNTMSTSLFVLWGGANDVLNHVNGWFFDPNSPSPSYFASGIQTAMYEARGILNLAAGGDYGAVLFVDLPDISTVPTGRPEYNNWSSSKKTWVNQTTASYNQVLRNTAPTQPRTTVLQINAFIQNWLNRVYVSPHMTNFTTSCYPGGAQDPSMSPSYVDKPCPSLMFFDYVHPTTIAHCGIAGEIADVLRSQFDTQPVGDRGARINACAQRRQNPVRAFWRDAGVGPLYSHSHAQSVCPGACTQLGASLHESMAWNGNWTNTTPGNAVCGCNSQPSQPAALWQNATVGPLYSQSHAESVCPTACGATRNLLPDGMFWNRHWTNTGPGVAVCGCTSEAPL